MSCKLKPAINPATAFQGVVDSTVKIAVVGTNGAPQILAGNYAGAALPDPSTFTVVAGSQTLSLDITNLPGDHTQIVEVCDANSNQVLWDYIFDPLGTEQFIEIQGVVAFATAQASPRKRLRRAARAGALASLMLLSVAAARAQNYRYVYGDEQKAAGLASKAPADRTLKSCDDAHELTGPNVLKLALAARGPQIFAKKFVQTAENTRQDKQAGSNSSAAGTTSVVSKGAVSQLISLAVESGALTETTSQAVTTLHVNALNAVRVLAGKNYCAALDSSCESATTRWLSGLSGSVSLNTTSGQSATGAPAPTTNNAILAGSPQQVSSWGVRYDLNPHKSVTQQQITATVVAAPGEAAAFAAGLAVVPLVRAVTLGQVPHPIAEAPDFQCASGATAYDCWLEYYGGQLNKAPDAAAFESVLTAAAKSLVMIGEKGVTDFDNKLDTLLTSWATYYGQRDRALDMLVAPVTYSVEYDDNRPQNQPRQSNFKLIVSAKLGKKGQLTFNGSGSWYDDPPEQAAVKRFRDAQAALQVDYPMTASDAALGASFSAGFYYQYQADNALLTIASGDLAPGTSIALPGNASVLLNTKGSIAIGQVGVTFTVPNTSVKIPLSISYANRTDLIKASDVRGHFGITYDLDSLFGGG